MLLSIARAEPQWIARFWSILSCDVLVFVTHADFHAADLVKIISPDGSGCRRLAGLFVQCTWNVRRVLRTAASPLTPYWARADEEMDPEGHAINGVLNWSLRLECDAYEQRPRPIMPHKPHSALLRPPSDAKSNLSHWTILPPSAFTTKLAWPPNAWLCTDSLCP